MNKKINYKTILLILTVSSALGIIYNYFSSDGIPFNRKVISVKTVDLSSDIDSSLTIKGLKLSQVLKLYNEKKAIFIDARDQWDFSDNHIKDAINIPEFSFTENIDILSRFKKSEMLIVYCDGDDCDISKRLVNEFVKLGYNNSYVYLGGFREWLDSELPVAKSELK